MNYKKNVLTIFLLANVLLAFSQSIPKWQIGGNNLPVDTTFGLKNDHDLIFITNNIKRGILTNTGEWGLGTLTPTEKLEVTGNIKASGDLVTGSGNGVINCGGALNDLVNVIGDAAAPVLSLANGDEDLYIEDDLEVAGTIFSSGNMGIGVALPENKVHVFNGSAGTVTANVNSPLVVENSTSCFINVLSPAANEAGILFGNPGNAQDGGIVYGGDDLQFRTNGNINRMTIFDNGNVNITGTLDVTGATVFFGSVESISDGGANLIVANNDFATDVDGTNSLGTSANTWFDVFATDATINTSDVRLKQNIETLEYGLNEILQLKPVTFEWISKPEDGSNIGFIAQEVQQVLPEVVRDYEFRKNEETGIEEKVPSVKLGLQYDCIIPVLVNAIQEQQATIEQKESRLNEQEEQQMQELKGKVEQLEAIITRNIPADGALKISTDGNVQPLLGQNIPNPFDNSTVIPFRIPKDCNSASVVIYDVTGKLVTAVPISCNETHLVIESASLSSGTYTYSLIVNGNTVDTKQMVISK